MASNRNINKERNTPNKEKMYENNKYVRMCITVARFLSPFDKNELELWNVEFWWLKKASLKTLQIEFSLFK